MKAERARLDADRTAKPKSKITGSIKYEGKGILFNGEGEIFVPCQYINENQTILLAQENTKKE